jgi:predicted  nucleic acid-binding Zn-ribbon protein
VQVDVNSALDSIHEIRSEVEKQRNSLTELDMQKQSVVSKRAALEEIDQNIHQNSRQVARADEKLQLLRRQAATRGSETQRQVEELHKRLIDAENNRVQVRAKAEKAEGESTRLEREIEAESLAQEQERNDMATAYHRLEKVVIGHLQTLRKAMEEEVSVN